jgi:SAM-dependent methyltransferase
VDIYSPLNGPLLQGKGKEMAFRKGGELEELLKISVGFRQAKIILVAVHLGVFDLLHAGGRTAAEIAQSFELDPRAAEIFLDSLVGLKTLRKEKSRYFNSPAAGRFLVSSEPEYKGDMFKHTLHTWEAWSNLEQVLKSGVPEDVSEKKFLDGDEELNRSFILCMYQRGWERAEAVWKSVSLKGVKRMLDLGGGPGTYSLVAASQETSLHSVVFDLPPAVNIAREKIEEHGLQERISTIPGNFHVDDIGSGYDLILVSNILHSQSEEQIAGLLLKCYGATAPGGRIVIHDFDISEERTEPLESAIFAVHMLVATGGGRVYAPQELCNKVVEAGYSRVGKILTRDKTRVIEGWRG